MNENLREVLSVDLGGEMISPAKGENYFCRVESDHFKTGLGTWESVYYKENHYFG